MLEDPTESLLQRPCWQPDLGSLTSRVWEVSGVQGVNDIFVTIQDDKDGGF
jgi:hypothetical protein